MAVAEEILERYPHLKVICNEIANNVPVESIILCGSRATNQGVTDVSDYDLPVVMKTYLIPFYLPKLKKAERGLKQKLGVNITLNPLPTFRVKRAKGNLFLFKVKREGITIYGKDYIKDLDPGKIEDIPADRYFSFLFSAGKDLIQNFDPRFLKENPSDEEGKKILHDAAKTMIYCAELRLLLKGYYETNPEDLILGLSVTESENFLRDLEDAIKIKNGNVYLGQGALEFWFKARDHIIETFRILMQNFVNADKDDIEALIQEYLSIRNSISIKNFEYFALTSFIKKEVYWRALFTKKSVEDRMRAGLLYLLLSIRADGSIKKGKLDEAHNTLKGFIKVHYVKNEAYLWKNMGKSIINHWPYACTVIGI